VSNAADFFLGHIWDSLKYVNNKYTQESSKKWIFYSHILLFLSFSILHGKLHKSKVITETNRAVIINKMHQ
jgi:hypothetical protein